MKEVVLDAFHEFVMYRVRARVSMDFSELLMASAIVVVTHRARS
jgi:hypothetical protein